MRRNKNNQYHLDWMANAEDDPDSADSSLEVELEDLSPLPAIQAELAEFPTDPDVLLRAALAALFEERPELSLRYQHRFSKRYSPLAAEDHLLRAVALAQQGRWPQAAQIVKQHGVGRLLSSAWYLPCDQSLLTWFRRWLSQESKASNERGTCNSAPRDPRLNLKANSA